MRANFTGLSPNIQRIETILERHKSRKSTISACVLCNGCDENQIDSARVRDYFINNGVEVTAEFRDADIIIFNSCGLSQYNEERSVDLYNYIKAHKKPSAELILCGCLPKINPERVKGFYQGPTFGSDELEVLDETFNFKNKVQGSHSNYLIGKTDPRKNHWLFLSLLENGPLVTMTKILTYPFWSSKVKLISSKSPNTFSIKVSTGCLSACSYCGALLSRGILKSKSLQNVIDEFEEGLKAGRKEFALIGTDVGAYGRDIGTNFVSLLTGKADHQLGSQLHVGKFFI